MKKVIPCLVFVCFVLAVFSPGTLAQEGVLEEPDFPTCPAGYTVVGQFGGAGPEGFLMNPEPSFRLYQFDLECPSELKLIGWAGEGHPEVAECNLTGGTDPFWCDQQQDYENFFVELDGVFLGLYTDYVGEIENAWFPFGPWDAPSEADVGTHELLFAHTLEGEDFESVLYKATLCARCIEEDLECRVTGGGIDEFTVWNGKLANAVYSEENGTNVYSFGGQAGAPTASQPQPYGEWVHHQKRGPDGSFVFHAGTSSAPEGTEIDLVQCSDAGWCVQARQAPAKQIDFEGIGTFKNIRKPSTALGNVVAKKTFHWFEVHIEDLGEPGKGGKQPPPESTCPPEGSAGLIADCDCPDFYYIAIYEAYDPDKESPNMTDIIYQVYGYIKGGNLQIHPPIK